MNRTDYLYIGIVVYFISLALIQFTIPDMLPASLYISIAWISIELTLIELMKTIMNHIIINRRRIQNYSQSELELRNRLSNLLKDNYELKDLYEENHKFIQSITNKLNKYSNSKMTATLNRIIILLSIIQTIVCSVQFSLMLVKKIPTTIYTNKIISVLSLLSFAFLLLSLFITQKSEESMYNSDEKMQLLQGIEREYTVILERFKSSTNDTNYDLEKSKSSPESPKHD